ncbi:hypothetical protein [Enterovirga rhinocerotis]|uniref:Uncharacterized protein n=1 Tax=Enterovirga rhinocerotis TaxID=1339210 RepID=A0A4R7C6U4_9HYPH|nr:hypothetical protein [Enterovirga rhinocerotis]TDR94304.1 hypothetical protein EV668_1588 [Enterovirga rhinocerotis]
MSRPIALIAGIASLVLGSLASVAAVAAEPVFPSGSRIGLVPPPNMTTARGLSGFRNTATGAGIVLIEMPADAYPGLAATFTDQALRAQGFALKSRDKPKIAGGSAILITGEQMEGQRRVVKSVLLAADKSMTALVLGQLPDGAAPADISGIEKALRTVTFRAPLTLDEQMAALPFTIADRGGFRLVRTMAGNSAFFTDGPDDVVKGADQPVLILAQSFAPPPPPTMREQFARQALTANNFIKDAVLERSQGYRQGGVEWHEIVAKAKDTASDTPITVMQTIRFESDGYVRGVGVVRSEKRDEILPRFRRVVDSVSTD